jgi:hypothetical protein
MHPKESEDFASTHISDSTVGKVSSCAFELSENGTQVMSATLKQVTAKAEGLTPEQLMQELIEKHLERTNWEELVERGRRQSEALGYSEDDVERLVHEHRAEKRQQYCSVDKFIEDVRGR